MSARIDNLAYQSDASSQSKQAADRIDGVQFKYLRTFPDSRGYFREVIRVTDPFFSIDPNAEAANPSAPKPFAPNPFAQWSHSKMQIHTVKAWHFHHRQIDWWYVGDGVLQCALYDNRPQSSTYQTLVTFKLGDSELDPEALAAVVRIPQGVLHGCRVLTEFASMLYITSHVYDPKDEGRLPFNSADVPYSWGDEAEIVVADNDRKIHIPPYELP